MNYIVNIGLVKKVKFSWVVLGSSVPTYLLGVGLGLHQLHFTLILHSEAQYQYCQHKE